MIYEVCSFYDSKIHAYSRPFYIPDIELSSRVAVDVLSHKDSDIARHPSDFVMFHVGSFNDKTGELIPVNPPVALVRMHEVQLPLNLHNSLEA